MKIVIAVHGTRGDIEPAAAAGQELRRRGHDVRLAVPPNLVDFVGTAGSAPPVSYGVDSQKQLEQPAFGKFWKLQNPITALREGQEYMAEGWADMSRVLTSVAEGADLILTGTTYQEVAANVAEHHRIPLAALHYFPHRANSSILPVRPPTPLTEQGFRVAEWVYWRITKSAEDAQRRDLGLPPARVNSVRRIVEGGALEIQAYDGSFFPGLSEEWGPRRPFVGALTMALPTAEDPEVLEWIGSGPAPIYFGLGSMPVASPVDTVQMIVAMCRELGERVLISSPVRDLDVDPEVAMIVGAVNHAAVFPRCRAVVHHGGAGTTAAGLRAGMPTLILWVGADQPVWATQIKRLGLGTSRRFSRTSPRSLRRALRTVLAPEVKGRADSFAAGMTTARESVTRTADLLEAKAARRV
ncbi:glycosyltransferase [Mycolicibacterium vaccae]|uniref:glycosyltransferase n=1 Tax=Mycolicibacterium vaccae TaxID=1810 RepID=UPI003CFBDBD8